MDIDEYVDELSHPPLTRRPLGTSREFGHQHRRRTRRLPGRVDADQAWCWCRDALDEPEHGGFVRGDRGICGGLLGSDVAARIQRRNWRGRTAKKAIYTYPSKKSLRSSMDKVRTLTRRRAHRTLADLLRRINPTLRGWCNYFRHGVSSRTFNYIDHFAFWRIVGWLKKRHVGLNMHTMVRCYLPGWTIHEHGIEMFRPNTVAIERYRYRGANIPTPWTSATTGRPAPAA